ncbi:hypothetical protein [Yinghuangia sp. YIM S10712]|uniref:hypothetical protein n=1 Tax=Yinghuangia sp. YIM S10712 TaxID=3436930 RepID=UPI003F52972D
MDPTQALHRARQAMHAYDQNPHDPFAQHRAAQDLRDAFAELDHLLGHGAPVPASWAVPRAEGTNSAWRVAFRNSAGHTVAIADVAAPEVSWAHDRVTADLEIYFSWMIKDAVIYSAGHDTTIPVTVPNPTHERTRAELDRMGRDIGGEVDG